MKLLNVVLVMSLILPAYVFAAGPEDCNGPLREISANRQSDLPQLPPVEFLDLKILDEEIAPLDTEEAVQSSCVESKVCKPHEPAPTAFRFLHKFILKTGEEFKESVLAIRGKNLRARPIAMADFIKNMAITWPGQIFGAMKQNGDVSLSEGLRHLTPSQYKILSNTLLMVWTQSDRGAGATKEMALPDVKNFKEFADAMKVAYKGEKGFWPEVKDRLYGFLTLIPFEMVYLSLTTSLLAALPSGHGVLTHANFVEIQNMVAFSFLFGTFLSFKWALVSKVFDLRGLPILRNWATRDFKRAKENAGVKTTRDEISFGKLITTDFLNFLRDKDFKCNMNSSCQFTDERLSDEELSSKVQYSRRWKAWGQFWSGPERKSLSTGSLVASQAALPVEMLYRYGNSLFDGLIVFWFVQRAAPFAVQWLNLLVQGGGH